MKGFQINWRRNTRRWHILPGPQHMPIRATKRALTDLINRDAGKAFLLPSLSHACGQDVILRHVKPQITISRTNEGGDSGIFKVTAEVNVDGGYRPVSFCLHTAKGPELNDLHSGIFTNLRGLRLINDRYVVEPFCFGEGRFTYHRAEGELAVYSTEWLEGFIEVNMLNAAYLMDLDSEGSLPHPWACARPRQVLINDPAVPFLDRMVEETRAQIKIAGSMVKILALYFNPATGEGIRDWLVNAGDFVYRQAEDGSPTLKLITARGFSRLPDCELDNPDLNKFIFTWRILNRLENSVTHQDRGAPGFEWYAIYPFTVPDIHGGIIAALKERYGGEHHVPELLRWANSYLSRKSSLMPVSGSREFYRDAEFYGRADGLALRFQLDIEQLK
ncbi:MAG: hypothetical protein KKB81_03010 [Candidatus Margulisbacteria bacterium]|nr:hypothetical protein [Candidatus Margulisiibacteriota bacterium]MBU1022214.1 hypothetical protein [Candidatus Margulisiibacteriota bacterium]MBU1729347.1 hypothetical protein [Candidatus Margulisiibacteriota bacterium]MBU1767988.1 hypothetical protein [Candidatus Omnitrophota bacterium]MBU1955620.1 hypothetical protein [Candidatus Margulisiibacteriota bacterium]